MQMKELFGSLSDFQGVGSQRLPIKMHCLIVSLLTEDVGNRKQQRETLLCENGCFSRREGYKDSKGACGDILILCLLQKAILEITKHLMFFFQYSNSSELSSASESCKCSSALRGVQVVDLFKCSDCSNNADFEPG